MNVLKHWQKMRLNVLLFGIELETLKHFYGNGVD